MSLKTIFRGEGPFNKAERESLRLGANPPVLDGNDVPRGYESTSYEASRASLEQLKLLADDPHATKQMVSDVLNRLEETSGMGLDIARTTGIKYDMINFENNPPRISVTQKTIFWLTISGLGMAACGLIISSLQ